MKLCNTCGIEKPMIEFYARTDRAGTRSQCKHCVKQKNARSKSVRDPGERAALKRRELLKRRYGISPEVYEEMLLAQGDTCNICGSVCATGRRLAVDHDHATGAVRALLCFRCNTKLGWLEENFSAVLAHLGKEVVR